jgi:hypothetical protein
MYRLNLLSCYESTGSQQCWRHAIRPIGVSNKSVNTSEHQCQASHVTSHTRVFSNVANAWNAPLDCQAPAKACSHMRPLQLDHRLALASLSICMTYRQTSLSAWRHLTCTAPALQPDQQGDGCISHTRAVSTPQTCACAQIQYTSAALIPRD